jgi:hypothetical protein
MKLGIAEILEITSKKETKAEKIEVLRQHDGVTLRTILQGAFDPNIEWDLPEGDPPYKPCIYDDMQGRLYQETRRLWMFLKGRKPELTKLKKEVLFIGLIESLDKDDAKLMLAVKDKKMPYKGITYKLVQEAFPDLLPANEQTSKS